MQCLRVPAARSDNHFGTIFDAFLATITLDPAYQGGAYTSNPVEGIRSAALIYFPWTTSDEYLATLNPASLAQAQKAAQDAWANAWDANSMISRYRASKNHDTSKPFDGDMMKALAQVKAKALLPPSMTDRTVPAYLTRELYKGIPNAVYVEIPTIRGDSGGGLPSGTPEHALITERLRTFLDGLRG